MQKRKKTVSCCRCSLQARIKGYRDCDLCKGIGFVSVERNVAYHLLMSGFDKSMTWLEYERLMDQIKDIE